MNIDSQIANLVIDHFIQKDIPVLCIHDSFIIQHDKEPELRRILDQATHQVTNYTITTTSRMNVSVIEERYQVTLEDMKNL